MKPLDPFCSDTDCRAKSEAYQSSALRIEKLPVEGYREQLHAAQSLRRYVRDILRTTLAIWTLFLVLYAVIKLGMWVADSANKRQPQQKGSNA